MSASSSSWLDELTSPDPGVRSRSLEAFGRMEAHADVALGRLVGQLDALRQNLSTLAYDQRWNSPGDTSDARELSALSVKVSALWRGFGEIAVAWPDAVSSFLGSRPETVKWLGRSAPPEFLRLLCDHENHGLQQAGTKAVWWIGRV